MEDLKPEGWKQLGIPHGVATANSTSLLRRSSSWRSPKEQGYYQGPVAQVYRPPRGARPQSCIEGGTTDKWLQTLERIQSRPLQRQTYPFVDKTVSMSAVPSEMTGRNSLCPGRWRTPNVCPGLCPSPELLETNRGSDRSNMVHIKPSPSTERAQFCSLAPVRFGWLPIERHVILTDISNNGCRHDNSRYQKLKSPITPVLLSTRAKLNGSGTNGGEHEPSLRHESMGFGYLKTPVKTSHNHLQASGSVNSEGGRNGSQVWNPTVCFPSTVRPSETSKHPTDRRGSVPESPSSGCAGKFSSCISSITITSRKVTRSSSLPDTSRPVRGSMAMNGHPTDSTGLTFTPVPPQRKALVVKVTEQSTSITTASGPNATDQNRHHKGYDQPVVLRRKASIVKMVERCFSAEQPNRTQYRNSYTEGLNESNAIKHEYSSGVDDNKVAFTVSVQPGTNQWRSSPVHHRSSVSLHLDSNGSRTLEESDSKKCRTAGRPLSCDASLFNHTEPACDPKRSTLPLNTNTDLVTSNKEEESKAFVSKRVTGNQDNAIPRKEEFEPVLGIKPLTLLKVPDDSPLPTAQAVLALNAAAVIANIKLQTRQKQNHNTTSYASDEGKNDVGRYADNDGRNQAIICFGSGDIPPDSPLTPQLSLKEALAIRRPDFIQRSQARVQALERRSQERLKTLSSPHRPVTTCSQHPEDNLLKSKDRRVGGKDAHLRSRRSRSYNLLPEVRKKREDEKRKKEEEKRKLVSQNNRLRLELFKKKLLDQVLQRGNT